MIPIVVLLIYPLSIEQTEQRHKDNKINKVILIVKINVKK